MKKVGILGFAHGHVFSFAGEWMRDPAFYNVTVTGAWDHDKERLNSSLEKLPAGISAFESAEELLASGIDAVVISSETAFHADLVEKAAKAKKDIILYKPISLTMQEADRIVSTVNDNGVRLTMGWQMRCDPQNAKMRQIVQSGELGKTCLFRRRHGLATHTWADFENTWHVNPQMNRDIFADDSAHPINLMLWMFGMPETVMCEMSTMVNPKIPNDNAVCLFKYANGLICEISLSFTTSATEITTEIYLENGSIQQYFGDAPATRMPRNEKIPGLVWFKEGDACWTDSGIPSPKQHGERLKDQAGPMATFLNGGEAVCTAEEGRDTLRLVLSCYLSAKDGKRINVNDHRVYDL